ncbi:CHAD domain-containing protein [Paraburkholderia sp. DHOC27]|uniref:CHAD domain-containing protein n=1 Tax=Paraburkholderia sp. DHOC27 TaxID=2303330 RepID=UPI000E3CAE01|nr:CHAD domain-containing protein [Paraburkholderia sp. DHOC27]RFU48809.1 CHAD domain-containing protein [Paraburkholderia sp. DHOC27]
MVCHFELVLSLPRPAAHAWMVPRNENPRAWSDDELGAAFVEALSGAPRAARWATEDVSSADAACGSNTTITPCRDQNRNLAAARLRVQLETGPDGRRVSVTRHSCYSPALSVCEVSFSAPLPEFEAPLSEALAAAPHTLKPTLDAAGDLTALDAHAYTRDCWRWQMDDAVMVSVWFERDAITKDGEASFPFELRLTTPFEEDAADVARLALFKAANEVAAIVPAFPVLHSAREDISEDVSQEERDTSHNSTSRSTNHSTTLHAAPETHPARAAPIDLTDLSTPQAALIAIGGNLAAHWFGNDAGVRDAISVEFVHQFRVSQRRLKTALRIFPHWADEAWNTRIAPDLKWLGGILGEARDWDVFVDTTLPALAAADSDATRWNATRERANLSRLAARERVQAAVASTRYAQLALAWLEWLSALPSREAPAKDREQSLHAYAKKRVRKYYERLMSAPKLTTLDDEARHKERIHAKYLRYTLEFFESIASRKTRSECIKTLSRLQGVLGDGNDVAVALRYLEALDVEPYQAGFARGWTEAAKRYTAQEAEHLLRALREPKIRRGKAE